MIQVSEPLNGYVSSTTLTLRLPGEVSIDVTNASPIWVATLVAELTRSSS